MKNKTRSLSLLLLAALLSLPLAGQCITPHDLTEALAKVRHDSSRFAANGTASLFRLIHSFQ